jgi:hypothetical protein
VRSRPEASGSVGVLEFTSDDDEARDEREAAGDGRERDFVQTRSTDFSRSDEDAPQRRRGVRTPLRDARNILPTMHCLYTRPTTAVSRPGGAANSVPGRYIDEWADQAEEAGVDPADQIAQDYAQGSAFTRNAIDSEPDAARASGTCRMISGMSTATLKKYEKVWREQWVPFFNAHAVDAQKKPLQINIPEAERKPRGPTTRNFDLRDLTENDVMLWLCKLMQRGCVGPASLKQYHRACRTTWEVKMRRLVLWNPEKPPRNPFEGDEINKLRQNMNKRMAQVKPDKQLPRKALEPSYMLAILQSVEQHVERFHFLFGLRDVDQYFPWKFEFKEFLVVRAQLAVLIAYAFGLRAANLYYLTDRDIRVIYLEFDDNDNPIHNGKVTLQYDKSINGQKNYQAKKRTEPRVMVHSEFAQRLTMLFRDFKTMKLAMYSYRMVANPTGNVMDPQNFYPEGQQIDELRKQFMNDDDLDDFLFNRIPADRLNPEGTIFNLVGERFIPRLSGFSPCTVVTSWLTQALRDCGKYKSATLTGRVTSHVIRAGAVSAYICVHQQLLNRAKWWFGWKINTDTAEDHYIQFSWTVRDQPASKFFFGKVADPR